MTSYFWSGFPSLSGRSDVMYGRRHIGGTDPPRSTRHPYRLGLLCYRIAYRLLSHVTSRASFWHLFLASLKARAINEPILRAVARKRVVRGAPICGRSHSSLVKEESRPARARARTKSRLVFDLMAIRNYASTPGTAYACTANWPGQAARRGYISIIRGNYYERPSSSILIFCSRPLRPPPRQRLSPALCFAMEMIL